MKKLDNYNSPATMETTTYFLLRKIREKKLYVFRITSSFVAFWRTKNMQKFDSFFIVIAKRTIEGEKNNVIERITLLRQRFVNVVRIRHDDK